MATACLKGAVIAPCLALLSMPSRDAGQLEHAATEAGFRSVAGVYFFENYSTTYGILILDYDGSFAVLYQGCFGGGLLQRGRYKADMAGFQFTVMEGERRTAFSTEGSMHRVDLAGFRFLVGARDLAAFAEVVSSPTLRPGDKPHFVWYSDPSDADERLDFFRRLIPSRGTWKGN